MYSQSFHTILQHFLTVFKCFYLKGLWSVYPVVIYLISSQGIDFLAGAAALIENYISRSYNLLIV